MYTAKDMYEDLKLKETGKGELVDKWLKEEVLPSRTLTGYNSGYTCPDGITLSELEKMLELRGFTCKTWSDYQGNFVSIEIPPQGE